MPNVMLPPAKVRELSPKHREGGERPLPSQFRLNYLYLTRYFPTSKKLLDPLQALYVAIHLWDQIYHQWILNHKLKRVSDVAIRDSVTQYGRVICRPGRFDLRGPVFPSWPVGRRWTSAGHATAPGLGQS